MNASLNRRLDSLATAIKPLSPFRWLSADERAVLCIAELKYLNIPVWAERAAREELERASRGEALPTCQESPESTEKWKRLQESIFAANDRVRELDAEGRLQGVIEALKAKGVWRDDWNDQEPAREA